MGTYNIWVEKGYEHFGLYGPDHLSIKQISEELGISRTTFNYYFKNKLDFIEELINHHYDLHRQFCEAGKLNCKKYVPDVHQLLLLFPAGLKFHKQLFNHKHIALYNEVYKKCNENAAQAFVIRLYIDYYKLPLKFEDAAQLHESLVETWYSRLNIDELTIEKLVASTEEIMSSLLLLIENNNKHT